MKKPLLTISIKTETKERLEAYAQKEQRSVSQMADILLKEMLDIKNKKK